MTISNSSPGEQILVQEIQIAQKNNPHFGKRRIHDCLHKTHPTWSLSEKRVNKIMKKYNLVKALEISPPAVTGDTCTERMVTGYTKPMMMGKDKKHSNNQVEDFVSTEMKKAAEKEKVPEEDNSELSENQLEVLMEEKRSQEQSTSIMNGGHDDDARSSEKGEEDDNQMEHEMGHVTETTSTLSMEPSPAEDLLVAPAEADVLPICSKETETAETTSTLSMEPCPAEDLLVAPAEADVLPVCSKETETADMAVDDLIESTFNDLNEQRREEELIISQEEETVVNEDVVIAPMAKKKEMPMNRTTYGTPPKTENKEPKNQSTTVDPVDQQRSTCDCAVM